MWIKILLLFFVFSFLFRTDLSFDQDLGRHIKLGEIITKTGQIPKTNLFSYTNPDFPFINTHWLFEVVAYWFSQTVGLQVLLILKVVIILLSVWLIFQTIPKDKQTLLLPISFIFLHVLRERLELRPEIFSFLFTAASLFILERFLKTKTRWIFILPAIQLLWINTHIYFFVGLILQAIFILHLTYQYLRLHLSGVKLKILRIIFGLSVALSLINPHGLAGLLYPLEVSKNYGYAIVENQTMFFLESINFKDPNFLFVKLSIGLVMLSLLIALIRRKLEIKNILLSLSGMGLALMNVRGFPYLIFLSLPATLQNFGLIKANTITKLMTIIVAGILIFESLFILSGEYYKTDPRYQVGLRFGENVKGAMDFVLNNNLPGPIFNNFDIGSYIIFRGYPKYQVFVDGRPEAYPAQFFPVTYIPMQSDFTAFKAEEEKWGFRTIIFSRTDQTPWGQTFLQNIVKDPTWKLVFVDEFMIILSRL